MDPSDPNCANKILQQYHQGVQSVFVSTWMRPNPDPMDNIFGALYLFPMPKSFLDRNLTMYLFIKDEEEASPNSIPSQLIGFTTKTEDGRYRLSELLTKILFEVGNPT